MNKRKIQLSKLINKTNKEKTTIHNKTRTTKFH